MVKFSDFDVCKKFTHKDKAKILKYVELMYSKDSALNNIQNLKDRKTEACTQAKLNPKEKEMVEIMGMQNLIVNDLIFVYLSQFQSSNSYHQLCTDQQLYWSIQQLLMKPLEVDDEEELTARYEKRAKLSETSDSLIKRINRLYSEIYAIEEVREMAVSHVRQMLRPEERIRMRDEKAA
jgi:hypothetical protein